MSYANFQRTILLLKMLNIRALKYIINRVILAVFFRNMELDTQPNNNTKHEQIITKNLSSATVSVCY